MEKTLHHSAPNLSRRKVLGATAMLGVAASVYGLLNRPKAVLAQGAAVPNPETFTNSIGMEFMPIPAGRFLMGSSDSDRDAGAFENAAARRHHQQALPSRPL